jgi:hypothetical protein
MHVFVFQAQRRNSTIFGFTTRRTGSNLPEAFGPWVLASQGAVHSGDPIAGVPGGADTVLSGIEREGFFIAHQVMRVLR